MTGDVRDGILPRVGAKLGNCMETRLVMYEDDALKGQCRQILEALHDLIHDLSYDSEDRSFPCKLSQRRDRNHRRSATFYQALPDFDPTERRLAKTTIFMFIHITETGWMLFVLFQECNSSFLCDGPYCPEFRHASVHAGSPISRS